MRRAGVVMVALIALGLAGCETAGEGGGVATSVTGPEEFINTDEPARVGEVQFSRGNFALAEKYYKAAVEKASGDVNSWIGLAASYDHLKRFDLADRAYQKAIALGGANVNVLNNYGYSYLLRGDFRNARVMFQRANRADPGNPVVQHNMALLAQAESKFR